ncbi:18729_t:CDS:10, partial [Racocetra persica]
MDFETISISSNEHLSDTTIKDDSVNEFQEIGLDYNDSFEMFDNSVTYVDDLSEDFQYTEEVVNNFQDNYSESSSSRPPINFGKHNYLDNNLLNNEQDDEIYLMTGQLRVNEIIHSIFPMEYPPTSENGIAIIYNIEAWDNLLVFTNNMQYNLGKPSGSGDSDIYCPFLDTLVKKLIILVKQSIDEDFNHKRTKEAKTYIKYLALLDQKCPYDNYNYDGQFIVKKKTKLNLNYKDNWFVGCTKWQLKSKGLHFFYYLNDEIDSLLLNRLFEDEEKTCEFLYKQLDGSINEEDIIKMSIHHHPPPPLSQIPLEILNKLKTLIKTESTDITANKLLSSNLIKATFGKDYLSEVHNMDKLRRLIAKIQKSKHLYGQELLGLTYNIWSDNQELLGYVQQSASLNSEFSFIDTEIWNIAPDNTNVAELCHANINRDGKSLSLLNAIIKAKFYDEKHFTTCNIQKNYGISNTEKNKSLITREKQSIKRAAIKERELKLEREKLELMKLHRELSLSGLDDEK